MEDDPHDAQLVQPDEVEEVQALFAAQYADVSWSFSDLCCLAFADPEGIPIRAG